MSKIISPVIFVGHGSPMTAISDNKYRQTWRALGKKIVKPKAILVISAHWNIDETAVSDIVNPRQIYDFYGFLDELYNIKYAPKGNPELSSRIIKLLAPILEVKINNEWGIDHGSWVPLSSFFPQADIPVLQLSIDYLKSPEMHYKIGAALKPLREEGVLIIGSGDIVHNLTIIKYEENAEPYDWAVEFEAKILKYIDRSEHGPLINYSELSPESKLAIPSPEHYLPLLYILALQDKEEKAKYFVNGIDHGSVSMTSFIIE